MTLVRRGKPFAEVAARRAMVGRNRSRTDPTAGRFRSQEVSRIVDVAFDSFRDQVASRDPVRRLRMSVNGFLSYPFGRPGYQFDDVPQADGRSLNMVRCPVADFLGRRDAADLCAESWCNLDYALADMWGARLERTGTLVAGASCCDFRFRTLPG